MPIGGVPGHPGGWVPLPPRVFPTEQSREHLGSQTMPEYCFNKPTAPACLDVVSTNAPAINISLCTSNKRLSLCTSNKRLFLCLSLKWHPKT